MKKKVAILLAAFMIAAVALTGCGGSSVGDTASTGKTPGNGSEAGDISAMTLTIAGLDSDDTAKAHDLRLFIDKVKEASGGKITFTEYWDASLGAATDNLTTIGNGIADVGTICTLYTPTQLPLSQITYCVPFAPPDPKIAGQLMYKISKEYPEFYKEYEKNSVVCLAWKGNEEYKLYSKNPITSLSDLDGMKITLGGVYYVPWFESQGAVPVTAPAADLYQTVKTGVATGSFVYDSIYCNFKLYEVEANCMTLGIGARNCDTICFNKAKWDSLDPKVQELFQKCADEAMGEFQDWEAEQIESWTTEMKNNGVVFTELSAEDKATWAKEALAYKDTLQSWIDDATAAGCDGSVIMSSYLKAAQDLGYTWPYDVSAYIK